ncbi:MAG: FHA domain-containing protein [Cyanobacteria bacterium P01_H01_bin.105]
MAYLNNLAEYHKVFSAEDEAEMDSKLGLFRAFSKLCEHNRELLDDMIATDTSAISHVANYIQGMIGDQQVYIISNLATGKSKSLYSTDGLWTIGRDPRQSDIAVPDKRLSRCHAAVQYSQEQGFVISDLESTNGTYVNGEKLKRVYALRDGDRIRIGSSLFHFFLTSGVHTNQSDAAAYHSIESLENGRTLH